MSKQIAETTMHVPEVDLETLAAELFRVWSQLRNCTVASVLLQLAVEGRGWVFVTSPGGPHEVSHQDYNDGLFALDPATGSRLFLQDGVVVARHAQPAPDHDELTGQGRC